MPNQWFRHSHPNLCLLVILDADVVQTNVLHIPNVVVVDAVLLDDDDDANVEDVDDASIVLPYVANIDEVVDNVADHDVASLDVASHCLANDVRLLIIVANITVEIDAELMMV